MGSLNDPLEREADAVAERVMQMADTQTVSTAPPMLNRKASDSSSAVGVVPAAVHNVLRSPGQSLDTATRHYFEPRFGRSFDEVRVHTDTAAQQSARDVDAQAYTVGRDIVFDAGKFAPETSSGLHLLAHELAHVVQQNGAATYKLQRAPKITAQFGDIKPHKDQGKAQRSGAIRLSEHEHIRARINLWLQTFDPQTGTSPYDNAAYRRSSTITIPKDMANIKTRMDMKIRDRLIAAQNSGVVNEQLLNDIQIEADIERTVRARELAMQARRRVGAGTTDLEVITTEKITAAAHYQHGELLHVGKAQRSPITAATDLEIDAVLDRLHSNVEPESGSKIGATPEPDASTSSAHEINEANRSPAPDAEATPEKANSVAHARPAAEPPATSSVPKVQATELATRAGGRVEQGPSVSGEVHAPQRGSIVRSGGATEQMTTASGEVRAPQRGSVKRSGGAVEHVTSASGEIHKPKGGPVAPTSGSSPRPSAGQRALGTAGNAMNVAGLVAVGGEFVKQLAEGDYVNAAKTAGLTGGAVALTKAGLGRWAGPLALAYGAYEAYDEEIQEEANRAGSRVDKALGGGKLGRYAGATTAATVATGKSVYKGVKAPWEAQYTDDVKERSTGYGESVENFIGQGSTAGRVAGAVTTSVAATGEVAFRGTFGVAGRGIGEGLAAGYLWLTGGDDEYEVPVYYEQFAANVGRLNRAKAHLNQVAAAQPDSPAAAAAGQMFKQVAELEATNERYRQQKTWTFLLNAQARKLEQEASRL